MPHQPYHNKAGKRLKSVTTIIGRFKPAGALIRWAYQVGLDYAETGISIDDIRDTAADIGSIAHEMVECHIRGKAFDSKTVSSELLGPARVAYGAFETWANQSKLELLAAEQALVSEEYQYGGCLDAIIAGGEVCIGDWKTSNALYPDYVYQLAAYRQLWNENRPDCPITGGGHLVRFGKEYGDFAHRHFTNAQLDMAFEVFLLMNRLYDAVKVVERMAK